MCQDCLAKPTSVNYRILRWLDQYLEVFAHAHADFVGSRDDVMKTYMACHESTKFETVLRAICAALPHAFLAVLTRGFSIFFYFIRAPFVVWHDLNQGVNRLSSIRIRLWKRSRAIVHPPGERLLRLAEILFSPKTVALTFKPLVGDWQYEYFEALKARRSRWHLRIMRVRYTWEYTKACGLSKFTSLLRGFAKL